MCPASSLLQQKHLHFVHLGLEGFCFCATLSHLCAPVCQRSAQGPGSEGTMTRDSVSLGLGALRLVMQASRNIFSSELMEGAGPSMQWREQWTPKSGVLVPRVSSDT